MASALADIAVYDGAMIKPARPPRIVGNERIDEDRDPGIWNRLSDLTHSGALTNEQTMKLGAAKTPVMPMRWRWPPLNKRSGASCQWRRWRGNARRSRSGSPWRSPTITMVSARVRTKYIIVDLAARGRNRLRMGMSLANGKVQPAQSAKMSLWYVACYCRFADETTEPALPRRSGIVDDVSMCLCSP